MEKKIDSQTGFFEHEILKSPFYLEEKDSENIISDAINAEVSRKIQQNSFCPNRTIESFASITFQDEDLCEFECENQIDFKFDNFIFDRPSVAKDHTEFAQTWIGHVTKINKTSFDAKLFDLKQDDTFEIAEFDISDISDDDKELFEIGSIFYWNVVKDKTRGQIETKSFIRFQRLKPFTEEDVERISDKVNDLLDNLKWDE